MNGDLWKRPVARIHGPQKIVGTGMLAPGGVVLTCAHVVVAALQDTKVTPGPGAAVTLDLPSVGRHGIKAVVAEAGWYPKIPVIEQGAGSPPSDLAVLAPCKPEEVADVAPCLVAEGIPAVETRFSAWGFPDGWPGGALSQGVLQGSDASGRLDAIADNPHGHFVDPGFSGAPVFEGQGAGVVAGIALGLCVTDDQRGRRIARIIPPTHVAQALRGVVSPYRWLTAFGAGDAPFFFGREELADVLWQELRERRALLLAGPPGSGKSSVLRAGLGSRAAAAGYVVRTVRPLADAQAEIAAAFGLAREATPETLAEAIQGQAELQPLLLGIDQAEELVRGAQAGRAAELLLYLAQSRAALEPRLLLVLAARVDALAALFAVQPRPGGPRGPGLLERHLRNLDPLGREELLSAVKGPAARLGVRFAGALAEHIVEDAVRDQVPLPAVQLCLSRLWESRRGAEIPADAYREMGGVTGALARHASGVLDDISAQARSRFGGVDGAAESVADYARRLLLHLVDVGASEQNDQRRRVPVSDLPSIDHPQLGGDLALDASRLVRKALEEGRLVVAVRLASGIEALELAHDSLLATWTELSGWIAQDRAFHAWHRQIRPGLRAWLSDRGDEGPLLRGSVLAQAEEWLAKKKISDLDRDEIAFVEASLSLAKREAAARQAAQLAELNLKREAAISQSLRLAVAARGLVARSPETALLVAGEAILLDHNAITDEVLREAADAIRAEVLRLGIDVVHVAFTPDGEILTLSADGVVRRFDDSGRPLDGFQIEGVQAVVGGACSPDGDAIVALGADGLGHLVNRCGAKRAELPAFRVPSRLTRPRVQWSLAANAVLATDEEAAWVWNLTDRTVFCALGP